MVASELAGDDPPGVYLAAQGLLAPGHKRDELLHMLARQSPSRSRPPSKAAQATTGDRHLAALPALPESYERAEHNERSNARTHPRRRHTARRRRRR